MTSKVRDPKLLRDTLKHRDLTQAQLARRAERSKQFIGRLMHGLQSTCTDEVASAIERSLDVAPGTLFLPSDSHSKRNGVVSQAKVA